MLLLYSRRFYHWHWQVGAHGVIQVCWGSVSLLEELRLGPGRTVGQVVEILEGMEAGLLGTMVAWALLEN